MNATEIAPDVLYEVEQYQKIGADPLVDPDGNVNARCAACRSVRRTVRIERRPSGDLHTSCENGCSTVAIAEAFGGLLVDFGRLPEAPRLAVVTAEELDSKTIAPLRWIIPGILPEGLTIVVGAPKAGKSALCLGWADCLASGLPVMGRIPVEKCEALYLALEDGERRVRDRHRRLRAGRRPTSGLYFVTLDTRPPMKRLEDGGAELIEQYLDAHPDCRVVFIDTWARLKPTKRGRNQQDYDADAAAWAILQNLAVRRRIAIVVVHHTRKPLIQGGDWLLEVSGTTGITGTCDTAILFTRTRGESTAMMKITGREHDGDREYALIGDEATKSWTLAKEPAEDARLRGNIAKIVKELHLQGPMWSNEIEKATGLKDARRYIGRMIERGICFRDSYNKYQLSPTYKYSVSTVIESPTVSSVQPVTSVLPVPESYDSTASEDALDRWDSSANSEGCPF